MRCLDLYADTDCPFPASSAIALGNFDGVHIGHRALFAALGDGMPRAVFTFADLRREGLICPLSERLALIRECGVRFALVCDFAEVRSLSPERFAELLFCDLGVKRAVCGYNFTFGDGGRATADALAALASERGAEAVKVGAVELGSEPVSSTRIRGLIRSGDMTGAAQLLGRPYGFSLPVVHGRRLGSARGYPTVNQLIPECLESPRFGVYASRCHVRGRVFGAVTNIGVRPTVDGESLSAETHIFDCSEDLYGENVRVELLAFLREERRFSSVDELFGQIARDADRARALLAEDTPPSAV